MQWNQLCHFVKWGCYERTWNYTEWLQTICGHILLTPLSHINKNGKCTEIDNSVSPLGKNPVIWTESGLKTFRPRQLLVKESVAYVNPKNIGRGDGLEKTVSPVQRGIMTKQKIGYVDKGKLSDKTKDKIRELAKDTNMNTDQIMKQMPEIPTKLRGSVTALLAIARRREKK